MSDKKNENGSTGILDRDQSKPRFSFRETVRKRIEPIRKRAERIMEKGENAKQFIVDSGAVPNAIIAAGVIGAYAAHNNPVPDIEPAKIGRAAQTDVLNELNIGVATPQQVMNEYNGALNNEQSKASNAQIEDTEQRSKGVEIASSAAGSTTFVGTLGLAPLLRRRNRGKPDKDGQYRMDFGK